MKQDRELLGVFHGPFQDAITASSRQTNKNTRTAFRTAGNTAAILTTSLNTCIDCLLFTT
jgi:hypothetical protein